MKSDPLMGDPYCTFLISLRDVRRVIPPCCCQYVPTIAPALRAPPVCCSSASTPPFLPYYGEQAAGKSQGGRAASKNGITLHYALPPVRCFSSCPPFTPNPASMFVAPDSPFVSLPLLSASPTAACYPQDCRAPAAYPEVSSGYSLKHTPNPELRTHSAPRHVPPHAWFATTL